MTEVKVKKLYEDAKLPLYATDGSAGADLCAYFIDEITGEKYTKIKLQPGGKAKIGTGLAFALPKNKVMLINPRSSMGVKKGLVLQNTVGVLDSDYRGECFLFVKNMGDEAVYIENGERLAQALIVDIDQVTFNEVEELDETERGAGGFGSTGKF